MLDITANSHMVLMEKCDTYLDKYDSRTNIRHIYRSVDFDRMDGYPDGYYKTTDKVPSVVFRAGSYSSYNRWRNCLALAIHGKPAEEFWYDGAFGAFAELINFSDCDGCIGPITSAKLAKDFAQHGATFRSYARSYSEWTWLIEKYTKFRNAFETASEGGFVEFH